MCLFIDTLIDNLNR